MSQQAAAPLQTEKATSSTINQEPTSTSCDCPKWLQNMSSITPTLLGHLDHYNKTTIWDTPITHLILQHFLHFLERTWKQAGLELCSKPHSLLNIQCWPHPRSPCCATGDVKGSSRTWFWSLHLCSESAQFSHTFLCLYLQMLSHVQEKNLQCSQPTIPPSPALPGA